MKKALFFLSFISFFVVRSQTIISDTVIGIDCYHGGSINLVVDNIDTHTLNWFFLDELLGWIEVDTVSMLGLELSSYSDTLSTLICGSFKVEIYNSLGNFISSTQMDWVDCPLGITPSHDNIKCLDFASGTGRIAEFLNGEV